MKYVREMYEVDKKIAWHACTAGIGMGLILSEAFSLTEILGSTGVTIVGFLCLIYGFIKELRAKEIKNELEMKRVRGE